MCVCLQVQVRVCADTREVNRGVETNDERREKERQSEIAQSRSTKPNLICTVLCTRIRLSVLLLLNFASLLA